MSRLPFVTKKDLPAGQANDLPLNSSHITMSLSNSPKLVRVSRGVAQHIKDSVLNPRLRELAIIQVGYSAGSAYEYTHHLEEGFKCGVTEDDVRAIAVESAGRKSNLEPLARAVLAAARELTLKVELSDETFAALRKDLNNEELTELFYAISQYNSVARMIAGFKLEIEDSYKGYLEKFPITRA